MTSHRAVACRDTTGVIERRKRPEYTLPPVTAALTRYTTTTIPEPSTYCYRRSVIMVSPPSSAGGYGPTKEAARITEWQPQSKNKRFSRKTILVSGVVATAVIIGLAIGLGVGLTTGGSSSDSDESETSPISTSTPIPTGDGTSGDIWQPVVRSTWQIVLQDPIDLSEDATSVEPDVDVYDIDLFTNDKATIDTLHRLGKRVICYFSAGSYEPYRPDSSDFRSADKGQVMDGWEDENWLDINSENVRSIMAARIELARDKGCDGIDPDNVDGYVSQSLPSSSKPSTN